MSKLQSVSSSLRSKSSNQLRNLNPVKSTNSLLTNLPLTLLTLFSLISQSIPLFPSKLHSFQLLNQKMLKMEDMKIRMSSVCWKKGLWHINRLRRERRNHSDNNQSQESEITVMRVSGKIHSLLQRKSQMRITSTT
jgi:hypothetical protein